MIFVARIFLLSSLMLPLWAAYEWRSVTFNVAYVPRLGNVSAVNVLDFWLTFFTEKM